jgi:hypothetical protein
VEDKMKSRIVVSLTMVAIFMLMASSVGAQVPRVNVMPGNEPGNVYPYTWPGRVLTIWGNVHDGTPPYTYVWEFGDGTPPANGAVTSPKYISVTHAYATMGPKRAVLTVTDANSLSDQDTVEIEVVTKDFPVEVNASIEDGLRWLYLQQQSNGLWTSYSSFYAAPTAMALLAFEDNGHLPINDIDEDIYAEYVQAGLSYLFTTFYSTSVPVQGAGDPEADAPGNTDHNGIGIGVNSDRNGYETGMAMMAIVGSGPLGSPALDLVATTGPANVIGRTYRDIVVDMVDWCAWAQVEPSQGYYRGGWRYTPNYSSSDNSVSQWPTIGLEAAETNWGIAAPSFVKSELLLWLSASQISGGFYDGAFWYTNYWPYSPIGVTGAGLCELSYADVPKTDPRVTRTISYLARDWGHSANVNDRYNLYAVSKGCRIAVDELGNPSEIVHIDGIDWYVYYATNLMAIQQSDGGWPDQWGRVLSSAWAILVLTPSVVGLPPVAVINAPASVPPNAPFNMDGSNSYHMDPDKMIVEWLWDFDKSDGVDWDNPDAIGSEVINPGYSLPGGVVADTIVVTLRVADNGDSVMTDIAEHAVIVNFENHPPIADPNGPYAAHIGETIVFDGTGSYDPDSGDYIVSYSWDINGDGIFGDCTDSVCQFSWNYVYSGYVGLVVTDTYGATSDTSQAYVTVWTSEVDVGLDSSDISFSDPYPQPGDVITITAVIHCDAESDPVSDVLVRFYDGDPDITVHQIGGDQVIPSMVAGDAIPVQVSYLVADTLPHEIYVRVDPRDEIEEYNENNNEAFQVIQGVIARCMLFVTPEVVTVDPGDTAHFMVGVWNMGGGPDDYLLRLSGLPSDFTYSLPETIWGVGVNDTMDVPLEITPPYGLPIWSDTPYPFAVACTSLTYPGVSHDTSGVIVINVRSSPGPRVRFTDVLLDSLIAQVEGADIEAGVKNSLLSKLDNAKKKKEQGLARLEAGDTTVAMNMFNAAANILGAFINELEAQRGQKITEGDADSFMAQAEDIIWRLQTGIWEGGSPPAKMAGEDIQSPQRFELSQNIPNPFNPVTQISYTLPRDGHVKLEIYNLLGQKVATLADEYQQAGQKTVNWEAKDLASGIYFYKLTAGDFTATKKMVLLR